MALPNFKTSKEIEDFSSSLESMLDDLMFRVALASKFGRMSTYDIYGIPLGNLLISILEKRDLISFTTDEHIYFQCKGRDSLVGKLNVFDVGDVIRSVNSEFLYQVLRVPTLNHKLSTTSEYFYELQHVGNTVFKDSILIEGQHDVESGKYKIAQSGEI